MLSETISCKGEGAVLEEQDQTVPKYAVDSREGHL